MAEFRVCPRCCGDGWQDEYLGVECHNCNGDGEVEIIDFTPFRAGKKMPMQDWEYDLYSSSTDQSGQ
jgi:DnaJ-class molecular chaperone